MLTRLFFAVLLFLISFPLFTQNLPTDMPPGTMIFEGEVLDKEGVKSTQFMDIPGIYTVNWFSLDVVYDGNIESTTEIPVITLGGQYGDEFLIANHAPFFDGGYKYIASVKECTNCVDGLTVYIPTSYIAEFQEEKFSAQRNALIKRTRTIRQKKEKECRPEEKSALYVTFGNIHVTIDGTQLLGSVEVKTRTNELEKSLVNLAVKFEYDVSVFGENAMVAQTIQPSFTDSLVEQWYDLQSVNLSSDEAKMLLEKDMNADQQNFIAINTILQPTMVLDFVLPLSALNNLPNALEELMVLGDVEASFFCEGVEIPFEEIIIEQHPIGVYFENDGFGGDSETIQYQFGNPIYNEGNSTYSIEIRASSSNPTRLRSGTIKVNYNSDVFTPFQTPTSGLFPPFLPNPQITSTGESSFDITFTDNDEIIQEYQEVSDNTLLFVVILAVDDCTQSAGLSFDEIGMQGLSTYVVEDNVNLPIVYEQVLASNTETLVVCCDAVPEIATLDPVNIIAGDAQILTITGSGFGDYSGGSAVLFHNGGYHPASTRPEYIAAGFQDFIIDNILVVYPLNIVTSRFVFSISCLISAFFTFNQLIPLAQLSL